MIPPSITRPLFAKSKKNNAQLSLRQHLQDTAQVSRLIFSSQNRVGRNFLKAFKLERAEEEVFLLNLEVASLFHDLGKANEGFADAIEGRKNVQVVRHEHLSSLVLKLPEIQRWLSENIQLRQNVILAAVLSHHLKSKVGEIGTIPHGCLLESCELYFSHLEFSDILNDIGKTACLSSPPSLGQYRHFKNDLEVWETCIQAINSDGKRFRRRIEDLSSLEGQSDRRLTAALKAALIVADSVASAVVREGASIEDWINENVHIPRLDGNELTNKIIKPCIQKIENRTGQQFTPAKFQLGVEELGPKGLLQAGCGSGKTLAAYYWAARQLDLAEYGRVIFLYPTRGTATEGFKDYTAWAPDGEAILLHGQSRYVLESILENPPESAEGKKYVDETKDRLYGLANFNRRFFSATVDQFLSYLQFNYASICMSVVLTDSIVVLDEIHSFDRKLFNTALEFLRSMNIPTLCMTATLPESRRKKLHSLSLEFFPTNDQRAQLDDLNHLENYSRYDVAWVASKDEAMEECVAAVLSGKKVLWVVNTVARCQQLAKVMHLTHAGEVICYHSRFRLTDREKWHKLCVDKFKVGKSGGVVAFTTQVCEMSLDMDADVLITELAPISSLIQRMGRANRHIDSPSRPAGYIAPIRIYRADTEVPYDKCDIEQSEKFVSWCASLEATGVSQSALSEGMERFSVLDEKGLEPACRLFDSGYFASPGELREIDEFTVPAILDGDLLDAASYVKLKKGVEPFIVPVPRRFVLDEKPAWLPKYLNVASAELYDSEIGFVTTLLEEN